MTYKIYNNGLIFLPPHLETLKSESEAKELLNRYKVMFYRNCYNFDRKEEANFWFVIKDNFLGLDEITSKSAKYCVKSSLKRLDIRIATIEDIRNYGYDVYYKSFSRYHGATPVPKDIYEASLKSIPDNVEYWGCFDKVTGIMVAYAKNYIYEDMCEYTEIKSIPEYMKSSFSNYGLIYKMNEHYLETKHLKYVCDGARSLTAHSNIQQFLIKNFKFRKAYCSVSMHYKPLIRFIVNTVYPFRNILKGRIRAFLKMEEYARN